MRVIAGSARGREVRAPRGMNTRPMMDIVKGSLFNMLDALGGVSGRALDLFAGSGSIGIEALSRGAEFVDFVEHDRDACRVLRENLSRLGFDARARIHMRTVEQYLGGTPVAYDVVFMDAPYPARVSAALLERIAGGVWLVPDGVVCIGHHKHEDMPEAAGLLERIKYRCFGASCISIYAAPAADTGENNV